MDKIILPIVDQIRPVVQGTNQRTLRMVGGFQLMDVRAALFSSQATGNAIEVDLKVGGVSILTAPLTVANGSVTTVGNASLLPAGGVSIADETVVQIDVLQVGDGTANGLTVALLGYEALAVGTYSPPPPPPSPATTWDPMENGGLTLSNGNLTASIPDNGTNSYCNCFATNGKSTGKVYWEVEIGAISGTVRANIGAASSRGLSGQLGSAFSPSWSLQSSTSSLLCDGVTSAGNPGTISFAQGQVYQFALDMVSGVCYVGLNGTWLNSANPSAGTGSIISGMTGEWFPAVSMNGLGGASSVTLVTSGFTYTPPTGFSGYDA